MSSIDKKNISANALDDDALENVSGGAQLFKDSNGDTIIELRSADVNTLRGLGYDVKAIKEGEAAYYKSLKNCNGKEVGAEDLESVLSLFLHFRLR